MENEQLVKAYQELLTQAMLNTSYLNVIMKNLCYIISQVEKRDYNEVVSEVEKDLYETLEQLYNKSSREESSGQ